MPSLDDYKRPPVIIRAVPQKFLSHIPVYSMLQGKAPNLWGAQCNQDVQHAITSPSKHWIVIRFFMSIFRLQQLTFFEIDGRQSVSGGSRGDEFALVLRQLTALTRCLLKIKVLCFIWNSQSAWFRTNFRRRPILFDRFVLMYPLM